MRLLTKIKRNFYRRFIGIFSFTSALFVFQACYGTPQDFNQDILIEGQITSKQTGSPIEGIEVSIVNNIQSVLSDSNGSFSLYTDSATVYHLEFNDIDAGGNGNFQTKDTTFNSAQENIYLSIELESK